MTTKEVLSFQESRNQGNVKVDGQPLSDLDTVSATSSSPIAAATKTLPLRPQRDLCLLLISRSNQSQIH